MVFVNAMVRGMVFDMFMVRGFGLREDLMGIEVVLKVTLLLFFDRDMKDVGLDRLEIGREGICYKEIIIYISRLLLNIIIFI